MALGKSNWLDLQLKFSLLGNGEKASSFQDQAYYKKPATWDWLWNCSWPSFCSAAAAAALPFQHGLLHSPYLLGVKIQGCVHVCVRALVAFIDYNIFISLTDSSKLYHLLVHELSFDIPLLSKMLISLVSSLLFITLCLLLLLALELYF